MSRRRLAASVSAAAALSTLPLAVTGAPANAAPDCRDLTIVVGGNGQAAAEEKGYPTLMTWFADDEARQGRQVESLQYPAGVWPTAAYTKDESVNVGERNLDARIARYRAECPGGNVKVIGHSLGAEVAGNQNHLADKTVTMGDPTGPRGIYKALPGVYPGTSNPGERPVGPNEVRVCHEFDAICDSPAPWSDPAKFVQGWAGYAMGWHAYSPEEAAALPPGDHFIEKPAPLPWLPESTPTGIPAAPELPGLPEWEPGPLPSTQDIVDVVDVLTPKPYTPTTVEQMVPEYVEQVLPPEVLAYVPPPVEQIIPPLPPIVLPPPPVLPPLPDLGIRFP